MNAHTTPLADPGSAADSPANPAERRHRNDGWTPDRQRRFLELIADGNTVDEACAAIGLSATAAYSFRRRAPGSAFALGWAAANLHARERVAASLLARAIHGQTETIERDSGDTVTTITRHRIDNRLGLHMLARLDKQAEAPDPTGNLAAARLIAQDFDAYLDLIGQDAGPARAGLFLGARLAPAGNGPGPNAAARPDAHLADLAPVLALARADRFLMAGAGVACEVDIADLDPAARADWTGDQWRRAEAAGLVALAPEPEPAPEDVETASEPQLTQFGDMMTPDERPEPVWWDEDSEDWRTRFPPPEGFDGQEYEEFGDDDYQRELAWPERGVMEAPLLRETAERRTVEGEVRDAWFAAYRADHAPWFEVRPPEPEPECEPFDFDLDFTDS